MKQLLQNMNRLVCLLLFLSIAGSFCYGETFVMDSAVQPGAALRVLSESSSEVTLEFTFGVMEIDSLDSGGRFWKTASIEGCGLSSESGEPELPQYAAWIRVPWLNPQIDVVETDMQERSWGRVLPSPEPMMRGISESIRRIPKPSVYERNRYYPSQAAACDVAGQISRSGVALVTITPVQVNSRTGNWRIHSRIQIRLSGTRRGNLDDLYSETYSTRMLLNTITRNPAGYVLDEFSEDPRMLLVTTEPLLSALSPYIEWKTQCGVPVETILYSNVAASSAELKTHLISRINNCTTPPEFLLIVGDVDDIPGFFGVGNSLTDHPYSTLNPEDYLPDISVGRIPCNTSAELSQWISRLLAYERDGDVPEYFNSTSYSSSVALDPQHGQDITNLFSAAGLVVNQLQQPQTGSLQSLLNALNQNPVWVFYIGHGYSQAWSSVSPHLQVTDVPMIEHSASAIVVSVACATADLDYPGASIAEEWFNQNLNGGLLAYIGATESTAFFRSDTIGIAALYSVFTQGIERLGPALDYGKLRCAEHFPQASGGLTEETIQQFVLLGDPSMRVYSQPPQPLAVTHAFSLPVGSVSLPVTVSQNGQALEDVEVCLSGGGVYSIGRTGTAGSVELIFTSDRPTTLLLTATARNATAYQSEIQLVPNDAPYVIVDRITVLDSEGDNDGRADRGETCELRIIVRNIGSQASTPGLLTIAPSNDEVQFAVNSLPIPAIPASESHIISQVLAFTVSPDATDGTTVSLEMGISENTGVPTVSLETLELHAPNILYSDCELTELAGDNDGNPEAGETLALDLFFSNGGSDRALPLAIDFHTSPAYLQIHDTRVTIDTVGEGEDFSARFLFDAIETTPRGYPFEFYVDLSGSNIDSQSVWDAQRVGQIPVLLYELDENPAQIDALEGCLSALGIEYERVTTLPYNLFRYRSVWIFCGVSPNARALPQNEAGRLAEYLEGGGSCYWEGADVWSYDSETALHPYFHIEGLSDGSSNAGPIKGEYGTSYQDYHFEYSGENSFIDQISPVSGATVILRNDSETHPYAVCVAYAGEAYRTIGSSIEIGLLDDAAYPSTRVHLIAGMLGWFGIESRVDIYPPVIRHTPLPDFLRRNVPIPVIADVQDASGIASVMIRYRVNEGTEAFAQMNLVDGLYRGAIPGMPWNTTIHYRIESTDNADPANAGATEEYTFRVRYESSSTLDLYTYYGFQHSIKPRIHQPKDASWAFTRNNQGREVLELHGISSEEMISYTTQIVDCSMLSGIRLKFWNYLRSGMDDHGIIARIMGSKDGGKTFPYLVWHRVQESTPVLEDGIEITEILDWIEGDDRVAFRFETNSGWYWRIGEIQIIGDLREELIPISSLTIRPYQGGVKLFWNSIEKALSYRVYMASVSSAESFTEYVEMQDTSYVDPESFKMDQRFYKVFAVMREFKRYEGESPQTTMTQASLGAADIRWNVRKNRLSR